MCLSISTDGRSILNRKEQHAVINELSKIDMCTKMEVKSTEPIEKNHTTPLTKNSVQNTGGYNPENCQRLTITSFTNRNINKVNRPKCGQAWQPKRMQNCFALWKSFLIAA